MRVRPEGDAGARGLCRARFAAHVQRRPQPCGRVYRGHADRLSRAVDGDGRHAGGGRGCRPQELSQTQPACASRRKAGRFYEDRVLSFTPNLSYRPVKFDRISGSVTPPPTSARLIVDAGGWRWIAWPITTDCGCSGPEPDAGAAHAEPNRGSSRCSWLGYAVTNTTAVYGGVNANTRRYDINERFNSRGFAVYGGVRLRPTSLTRLDVALGYQRQILSRRVYRSEGALCAGSRASTRRIG